MDASRKMKQFTPVRKLLLKLDLFKPSGALGKRRRHGGGSEDPNANTQGPVLSTAAAPPRAHLPVPDSPSCVALQNSDPTDFSDVVIITALPAIPFCCHEDLLTMSREQLIAVALSLNAKLPAALRIDVSLTRTDHFIRNSIELVVGLRRDAPPPAPRAVKSYPQKYPLEPDANRSPSTSPLAARRRSYDVHTARGTPRLARLEEEDEDDAIGAEMDRRAKKRRVSATTPTKERHPGAPADMDVTPTPLPRRRLLRAHTQRANLSGSAPPKRVLRSHSHKLPSEMTAIDTAFITTTRPRYRYRPRDARARVRTGTRIDGGPGAAASIDFRSFAGTREGSTSASTIGDVGPSASPGSATASVATASGTGAGGNKRRWSMVEEDEEMVRGIDIDGMSMCG